MTGLVAGEVVALARVADDVMRVDRVELRDGPKLRSISRIFKIVRDVRSRHFNLVIDLHSLSETNLLAFVSGARHRLLANRESRSLDWLSTLRPPLEDKTKHVTDRYLDVVVPFGITGADRQFRFRLSEDISDKRQGTCIGLFPGAGHAHRRWRLESFAELARRLAEAGTHCAVFLGPEEAKMRPQVDELFSGATVHDQLSINDFIAASAGLAVFVSNDTGPMHLAACAGLPIVLLLDEKAPATYLPLTDRLEVIQNGPIADIPVDTVFSAVQRLIAAQNDK